MAKHRITEDELKAAMCVDFSIGQLPNGKSILILICAGKDESERLLHLILNNNFDLQISADQITGNYSFDFQFIDSSIAFRFDTGKNERTYSPLEKMKNNQIQFITTGIWTNQTAKGRGISYNTKFMRLGLFDIGNSFKQATGVQFVPGRTSEEPGVVVLIFKDYEHIFDAEVHEAYNRLAEKIDANHLLETTPLLEIYVKDSKTIDLRIWDILIDLDIKFGGLHYMEEELKDFLLKTTENDSFAFAIGFPPAGKEKAALVSTKKDDRGFITLRGYTLKK